MIAEVAKYITKAMDFIQKDENGIYTVKDREALENLYYGTKGRRLTSYGGNFRKLKKEKNRRLKLEKEKLLEKKARESIDENGNYKEPPPKKHYCRHKNCGLEMFREDYKWRRDLKKYIRIYTERPDDPENENFEDGVDQTQCRDPPYTSPDSQPTFF